MSLTGANAAIAISVPPLFPTPVGLQGFEADNVLETTAIDSAEFYMGVDGIMSAGFVYVPIPMTFMLQADSASNQLFDVWWTSMKAQQTTFFAQGVIRLPAIGTVWTMTNGILTSYPPTPAVKKLIQPRHFTITWQDISPAAS